MKTLLVTLLMVLTLKSARADEKLMLTREMPRVRTSALKVNGKLLSAFAILFSAAGLGTGIAFGSTPTQPGESGRMGAGIFSAIGGGLLAIGALHAVIGIPLWVAGAKRENRWRGYAQANGLAVTF